MMQKLSLKKLKLKYSSDVLDIVQFGSSVIEGAEPRDIDVAVIFKKISLKDQLNQSQDIKKQLRKKFELPIHIKAFDLYSFFDKANFARENILFQGVSLISEKSFAEKFGFTPKIQISYSLRDLEKKDKVRFNYLLNGRQGSYGLLRKYGGRLVKPGLIEIFPRYEKVFISAIKKISSKVNLIRTFQIR